MGIGSESIQRKQKGVKELIDAFHAVNPAPRAPALDTLSPKFIIDKIAFERDNIRAMMRDSDPSRRDLLLRPRQSPTRAIIEFQGSVMRVKTTRSHAMSGRVFERGWERPGEPGEFKKPEANKSKITDFSSSSRRTLQDKLMSLSDDALENCKFVTLTYHEVIPSPSEAKAHLRAFFKRIVRYVKRRSDVFKPALFWRIEVKERKSGVNAGKPAPHFHLFLFGSPFIPKHILLKWWNEITGDPTITQIDIKRLDNRRKVLNYVSKYVSKVGDSASDAILDIALYQAAVGRWWGFEAKENIPFAYIETVHIAYADPLTQALIRFAEEMYPFLLERWSPGFRLFFFSQSSRDDFLQVFRNLEPNFDDPRWGWIDQVED